MKRTKKDANENMEQEKYEGDFVTENQEDSVADETELVEEAVLLSEEPEEAAITPESTTESEEEIISIEINDGAEEEPSQPGKVKRGRKEKALAKSKTSKNNKKSPKEPKEKKPIDVKTAIKNFKLKEFYTNAMDKLSGLKALDFRKLGFKILIPIVLCLAIILTVSVSVVFGMMASLVKNTYQQSCENSMEALQEQIDKFGTDSIAYANTMAEDTVVKSSVAKNDMASVTRRLQDFSASAGCDYLFVTDNSGVVIASMGSNIKKPNYSNLASVLRALQGESVSEIIINEDFPLVAVGAVPLYNGLGEVQGTVLMGYSLTNAEFLDSLKRATGNEFTIFEGDVRKNTTIVIDGKRQIETKADEKVSRTVLEKGSEYVGNINLLGSPHASIYKPLKDSNGKIIGMLFVGTDIGSIIARQNFALIFCIVLAIGLFVLTAVVIFSFVQRIVSRPLEKLVLVAEKIEEGDIGIDKAELDFEVSKAQDEVGVLSRALGETVISLKKYIGEISTMLSEISEGNLLIESKVEYRGDFVAIKEALENITVSLKETLSGITLAADQVSNGAEQVAGGAQALSQGATEQSSAIEELSATISDVSEQIKKNAENSIIAKEFGDDAAEQVVVSNEQMQNMMDAMENISRSTVEISKIIKAIDDVAFQTNILALNAAVEAARAGAAGKGFAVVADEVRKLAGKSSEAAEQTASLISKTTKAVKKGNRIAKETAKSLVVVVEKSKKIMEIIDEISTESNSQARAISEITLGVDQISAVVQTNSATAEESAAASEELSGQSALLNEMVSKFKISHD